ncbi:FH2 domain-containing protein [Tanacetum coccineum]
MLVLKIAFGKFLKNSIKNEPYQMRKIMDPRNPDVVPPIELFLRTQNEDDLSDDEKEKIEADGYVMNCILLCIPNSIYTTVDSYKTAKAMWERVRRHIEGTTLNNDDLVANINKSIMLLARAFTQQYFTPITNRLRLHQIRAIRLMYKVVELMSKEMVLGMLVMLEMLGEMSKMQGMLHEMLVMLLMLRELMGPRVARRDAKNVKNAHTIKCYNFNGKGHYATDCPQPRVRDSNYFKEHMMIAKEDEVWISIIEEYNDFLEDIMSNEEQEELNVTCIMMARIQEVNSDSEAAPYYDTDGLSKIPISKTCFINDTFNHERKHPKQLEFINETYEMINLIAISYLIVVKCTTTNREAAERNASQTVELEKYKERVKFSKNKQDKQEEFKMAYNAAHNHEKDLKQQLDTLLILNNETLELAAMSQAKMKESEIKHIDYTKLNNLYDHFVPKKELSKEQQYFSNNPIADVVPFKKFFQNADTPTPEMPKKRFFVRLSEEIGICFASVMSPSKRKFRWGIMRSTGIKRYIDPISGCKIWRTNRKCRIPIDLYPCKVEESMTMKKVGDQTIGVIRRRRIDKEGNVSRFQEYHTSDEEEEFSEHPPYNKYGFVDHP